MNFHAQLRQIARFGHLARYIDQHLDDALSLSELADIACMTRHRLDSAFQTYAQETPMSRVWRLRLLRARQQIGTHPERSLLDIALDAGYGSAAAFSRAFRRLHGQAPSAFRDRPGQQQPDLRIEALPSLGIQYLPYTGPRNELQQASDELRARAMHSGIPRHKRFGWAVNAADNLYARHEHSRIEVQAALLDAPLEQRIAGLDHGILPAGFYAVFSFQAGMPVPDAAALRTRIAAATGWHAADGPWLRRCRNAQYLPSRLESRFEVYIPICAGGDDARRSPCDFVLEK
ncbi:MAG: hypothetical protein CGU28_09090 [Candidatus Dactylopiibacterium carminicum]|uniref:AraC family transcriptional regulator n=1 Tax=Candidatus Dactylopiibacterium carminicum TaxID=857335 RepID=A0A272ERW9_9RHOO|nr:AraC family transcriptional regulator [Candidatus Dactylopiibacterium carminicum]KAF7598967.1 AraC family transcriptional regulator [Candidatus Dactylopiibacterium carminicum]PAS92847.1 MAG: hypothetical protein CGU29_09880 [Candidatus Dactylopiibacterium carminicum]PAS96351.1 MAG: hypothetical protein CGU28_09090 [Candidatus Dactylopiibacterium carminicum]PAS98978.1 MAG: hypothetical protein BSR46_10530 [Candidatus Dactylopiibacterium carminicum]